MAYSEYGQQPSPARSVESTTNHCIAVMKSGEQNRSVAGAGNTMLAPLISFLWGAKSRANRQMILSVYSSCWPAYVNSLELFEEGLDQRSCQAMVERALDRFHDRPNSQDKDTMEISAVHMVWYWDIMDDAFDTYYDFLNTQIETPMGCSLRRSIFVFCSQKNSTLRAITETRLKKLIRWATDNNCGLVVLSDVIHGGVLSERGVSENYHLAASIVQMQNAKNATNSETGSNLSFKLAKKPVWTAAYEKSSKNYSEIVYVSLAAIIQEYQQLERSSSGRTMVQSQMRSMSGGYVEWLDKLIEKHIFPMLPADDAVAFWGDLPDTEQMHALSQKLSGAAETRKPSLLQRWFGHQDDQSWEQAISSVGSIWPLCVKLHYIDAAERFLNSAEGRKALEEDIQLQITKQYPLNETGQIQVAAGSLRRELQDWNYRLSYPKPTTGKSLVQYLHECACVEVKNHLYSRLLEKIADTMDDICRYSELFASLLERVKASLVSSVSDENIRNAYGNYMRQLISDNKTILTAKIHPCKSEEALLEQLQDAFTELLDHDQRRIYKATFVEDFAFLKESNVAFSADDIFTSFFSPAIRDRGRLLSFSAEEGMLYCIMNSGTRNKLREEAKDQPLDAVGTQFIVNRNSEMERVYLYPIDPINVRY